MTSTPDPHPDYLPPLTDEQKAEIRLWFERTTGPDAMHWLSTQEFIDMSQRYYPRFSAKGETAHKKEMKDFINQLNDEFVSRT